MNKLKTILAATSIAAILTLSCTGEEPEDDTGSSSSSGGSSTSSSSGGSSTSSSSGGSSTSSSSGGSTPSVDGTTKTYALQLLDGGAAFTFQVESDDYESCENGILTPYTYEKLVYYGIGDNVLGWVWMDDGYGGLEMGDTLNFSGTSSNIIGTWTRTKNTCEAYDSYKICKEGYDITRAVFTDATLAITRKECRTDGTVDGITDSEGWTRRAVDCNTIQYSKDSRKITQKYTTNGIEWSYGDDTCEQLDKAQRPAACAEAYALAVADGDGNYANYYYSQSINGPYDLCIENTLPSDWWPEGGDLEYCDLYPEDEDCDDYDYCWMNPWCGGGCYYADECEDDEDYYAGKIAAKAKTAISAAKPAFKTKAAKLAFKSKAKTSKLNLLLKQKK